MAIPWWRNDVNIEDDLVEEVVRVIGYDAVPTVMLSTPIPFHSPSPAITLREEVRDLLAAGGMQEAINYPLVSQEMLDRIPSSGEVATPVRLANPMSATHEFLRPTLQAGLLTNLAANQSQGPGPFRLFEAGGSSCPQRRPAGRSGGGSGRAGRTAAEKGHGWHRRMAAAAWTSMTPRACWSGCWSVWASAPSGSRVSITSTRRAAAPWSRQEERSWDSPARSTPAIRGRFGLDFDAVAGSSCGCRPCWRQCRIRAAFRVPAPLPGATRDLALIVPAEVSAGR